MTSRDLQPILISALVDCGFTNARLTDTPEGLGLDSMDEIEVLMALDDALGIEIQDLWLKAEHRQKTFSELADVLAKRITESSDITP